MATVRNPLKWTREDLNLHRRPNLYTDLRYRYVVDYTTDPKGWTARVELAHSRSQREMQNRYISSTIIKVPHGKVFDNTTILVDLE